MPGRLLDGSVPWQRASRVCVQVRLQVAVAEGVDQRLHLGGVDSYDVLATDDVVPAKRCGGELHIAGTQVPHRQGETPDVAVGPALVDLDEARERAHHMCQGERVGE